MHQDLIRVEADAGTGCDDTETAGTSIENVACCIHKEFFPKVFCTTEMEPPTEQM